MLITFSHFPIAERRLSFTDIRGAASGCPPRFQNRRFSIMSIRDPRRFYRPMKEATMSPSCSPRSSISETLVTQDLHDSYDVIKRLGSGTYGKVVLAECKKTNTRVALKVLPKSGVKLKDFLREFNYSYYLSPHAAIIKTYDVSFETKSSFVFAQEHAPYGDLFEFITPQVGLPEHQVKTVAKQVASALEFMHSKNLVHRDIKPENVLIFNEALTCVKLMDFGMTKAVGTMVRKVSTGIPYTPPEICEAIKGERYLVDTSADVWGFGVLLFCCLTGNFPWELACHKDSFYTEFAFWHKKRTSRKPSQWKCFTERVLRLFRRILEIRPEKRAGISEVNKYWDDNWICQNRSSMADFSEDTSDSNPTDEIEAILQQHGIQTKVSKTFHEERIKNWVMTTSSQS